MIHKPFPFRCTSPDEQRALSLQRLLAYVRDVVEPYSPYYRRVLRTRGVDPAALCSYDDFRAAVPLTFKDDIVAHPREFDVRPAYLGQVPEFDVAELREEHWARYRAAAATPGIRDLFTPRPMEERVREQFLREWQPIHFQRSGGSTGLAITTGYTLHDIDLLARGGAWWYGLNGLVGPEDAWLNLLPAAPHLAIYAAMLVPLLNGQPNFNTFGGKVMPTERQVEMAASGKGFGALLALPSYLTHWLRTAQRMQDEGRIGPIRDIKLAICVGEPLTEPYRAMLRDLFAAVGSTDAKVLEGMSSTELRSTGFYECAEGSKLHFDPEYFFAEILHPETREPVAEGEPGVFVWSHIDWRGTALLRYWTGDLVTGGMVWGDCPHCGLTIPRLRTPIVRAERDFTKVRGARVEYVALQDAVRSVPGVLTYQITFRNQVPNDVASRDCLDVCVALSDTVDHATAVGTLRASLMERIELTADEVRIETAPEIEARLFAKKLKAEWIVDLRGQER